MFPITPPLDAVYSWRKLESEFQAPSGSGHDLPSDLQEHWVKFLSQLRTAILSNDGAVCHASVTCGIMQIQIWQLNKNYLRVDTLKLRPCVTGHRVAWCAFYVIIQAMLHNKDNRSIIITSCGIGTQTMLFRMNTATGVDMWTNNKNLKEPHTDPSVRIDFVMKPDHFETYLTKFKDAVVDMTDLGYSAAKPGSLCPWSLPPRTRFRSDAMCAFETECNTLLSTIKECAYEYEKVWQRLMSAQHYIALLDATDEQTRCKSILDIQLAYVSVCDQPPYTRTAVPTLVRSLHLSLFEQISAVCTAFDTRLLQIRNAQAELRSLQLEAAAMHGGRHGRHKGYTCLSLLQGKEKLKTLVRRLVLGFQ